VTRGRRAETQRHRSAARCTADNTAAIRAVVVRRPSEMVASAGSFLSSAENRGQHARVAAPVNHGDDPEWPLVRCVRDEILVAHDVESQRSLS